MQMQKKSLTCSKCKPENVSLLRVGLNWTKNWINASTFWALKEEMSQIIFVDSVFDKNLFSEDALPKSYKTLKNRKVTKHHFQQTALVSCAYNVARSIECWHSS